MNSISDNLASTCSGFGCHLRAPSNHTRKRYKQQWQNTKKQAVQPYRRGKIQHARTSNNAKLRYRKYNPQTIDKRDFMDRNPTIYMHLHQPVHRLRFHIFSSCHPLTMVIYLIIITHLGEQHTTRQTICGNEQHMTQLLWPIHIHCFLLRPKKLCLHSDKIAQSY